MVYALLPIVLIAHFNNLGILFPPLSVTNFNDLFIKITLIIQTSPLFYMNMKKW